MAGPERPHSWEKLKSARDWFAKVRKGALAEKCMLKHWGSAGHGCTVLAPLLVWKEKLLFHCLLPSAEGQPDLLELCLRRWSLLGIASSFLPYSNLHPTKDVLCDDVQTSAIETPGSCFSNINDEEYGAEGGRGSNRAAASPPTMLHVLLDPMTQS